VALLLPAAAQGHGLPIYVEVNPVTNQVEVSGEFDFAELDASFSSDRPGLGVLSKFSGIPAEATISLRVTQGLLFSNSDQLVPTAAELTIYSAEFAEFVTVSAESALQTPLPWAVYPVGAGNSWDKDGFFELGTGIPAAGLYGVGVQVLVDGATPSEPFLIPVLNNPTDLETALALLQSALVAPSPADFTRDWRVDADDLAVWEMHYGLSNAPAHANALGDADENSRVGSSDFLMWQRDFSIAGTLPTSLVSVPEPSGAILVLIALFFSLFSTQGRQP